MNIIQELKDNGINNVVYSEDIQNLGLINEAQSCGMRCFSALDARSALYMATGIAAQNGETVVCFLNSSNASRSAFSGMTEAFYRRLPVILFTIGMQLDYSRELRDVVYGHHVIKDGDSVSALLNEQLPIHVEIAIDSINTDVFGCDYLYNFLGSFLDEKHYLYVSAGIKKPDGGNKCKVVCGGLQNCDDGALANVLGASLAAIRERYIGIVNEREFLHDINTLGNINMNHRVCYIVVCDSKNKTIKDYAESLGFACHCFEKGDLDDEGLKKAVLSDIKTVIQIV